MAMENPQLVTINAVVYVADRGTLGAIHKYDPLQTKQWTKLPKYQYWNFAMTVVGQDLVLVGGGRGWLIFTPTNTVSVYSSPQKRWMQPFPPMKTPRQWPAASTYHNFLVVVGGRNDSFTDIASVEILDTSTRHSQWFSTRPLPVCCHKISSTILHNTLYLLGGSLGKQVLSVSLPTLTQTPSAQWYTLNHNPLEKSTAIAVHGFLLAVGGSNHDGQSSSAIHIYDQERNVWRKEGDLPTGRSYCVCCVLLSGEILVAGGKDEDGDWTSRMDVATVPY